MGVGESALEDLVMRSRNLGRPDPGFWSGKRVFLTGHTGFKGAWLALWLSRMGAHVTGFALPPHTKPSLFTLAYLGDIVEHRTADIRDSHAILEAICSAKPEIVLHLAAQALVREGYVHPLATFTINVQGTANLLDAVRRYGGVRSLVVVTSDKVYENLEYVLPYRETDTLGGHDPYSASKAASEIIIASYRAAFLNFIGTATASARAGNVIGGGDWAADRLIPDAIRAWSLGQKLQIRRPNAIRPWQHVLEPLAGYLLLAEALWDQSELAGAYNFGPHTNEAATVRTVVELARSAFGCGEIIWGDGTDGPHEAGWLSLEISKARHVLGIVPRWSLADSVRHSIDWYRKLLDGSDARELCLRDIAAYEASA
jgi:CDP-glucose 4,6-dehydratase